jgi:predicted ester cyclase
MNYANAQDWDGQRAIFSSDIVTITPGGTFKGWEAFEQFGKGFWVAAPDAHLKVDRVVCETDSVIVVEGTFTGTHTGPLVGPQGTIPATGRKFELPYCDIMWVRGGKVYEHHVWWDQMAFMGALGLLPEGAAAR